MYAAASAAAVAVVVWTAFPGWHADPQLTGNAVATAEDIPGENPVVTLPPAEVENYLLAHQPYRVIAPYVRSVSDERRVGTQ
jgi:hypothetical protein